MFNHLKFISFYLMIIDISSILPENTGECVRSQVMYEHQVSEAGQRLFRITHLLLQKAWNLFSLRQRLVHKTGEGLSDSSEGVLYKANRRNPSRHNLK